MPGVTLPFAVVRDLPIVRDARSIRVSCTGRLAARFTVLPKSTKIALRRARSFLLEMRISPGKTAPLLATSWRGCLAPIISALPVYDELSLPSIADETVLPITLVKLAQIFPEHARDA